MKKKVKKKFWRYRFNLTRCQLIALQNVALKCINHCNLDITEKRLCRRLIRLINTSL